MTRLRTIELITPATRSRKGNWITAQRWARILRQLRQKVMIRQRYSGLESPDEEKGLDEESCDLLLALHAQKSFASIEAFHRRHPRRPLIVTLTGTDLYRDIHQHEEARQALLWAHRLILLQPQGLEELPPELRSKARVIRQSAVPTPASVAKVRRWFDVCVVGHLRPVKDPFRTGAAARLLPPESRIRILHAGEALSEAMARQARAEAKENSRYIWLGDRPQGQIRRLLARSRLMVLSSTMEGGANVISEALVAQLPILATRISGSLGMLGDHHPGYFEVGDTEGLAALMLRCERDPDFLAALEERSRKLAPLYDPALETQAWEALLREI